MLLRTVHVIGVKSLSASCGLIRGLTNFIMVSLEVGKRGTNSRETDLISFSASPLESCYLLSAARC